MKTIRQWRVLQIFEKNNMKKKLLFQRHKKALFATSVAELFVFGHPFRFVLILCKYKQFGKIT